MELVEKVWTVEDVREHLHIGKNTAYALFKDKTFPSFKIGRKYFVLESHYIAWLNKKGNRAKYAMRY